MSIATCPEHTELLELRDEVADLRLAIAEMKAAVIEPEILARLIRLCHPDKHGNSEASNAAAAFLAQRETRS